MRSRPCFPIRACFLALLTLPLSLPASSSAAEIIRDRLWITDGTVRAIAYSGNTIYLGGAFSQVGPAIGAAALFDGSSGAALTPYWNVTGQVRAIASDGAGGYYVGGIFSSVRGQPRQNLARIDASGQLTAWNPGADQEVDAIAVSGSTVYVGGSFLTVAGQSRHYLAAIDAGTGLATSWAPDPNAPARAFLLQGSTLYVGGDFQNVAGQPRGLAASFTLPSGSISPWNPNGFGSTVRVIASGSYGVILGGVFNSMGGFPRNSVAQFDASGGILPFWDPNVQGMVEAIAQAGSYVWIGGAFGVVGGQPHAYLAVLDPLSGMVLPMDLGVNQAVHSLAARNDGSGIVYVAGEFTWLQGFTRTYLGSLDGTGNVTAWDPRPDRSVRALAPAAASVVAGGDFHSAGMVVRNNLAAIDAISGTATPWNPNANGVVNALATRGSAMYAGGRFTSVGGSANGSIAKVNLTTGAPDIGWSPQLKCATCGVADTLGVNAIVVAGNGSIYVGGRFDSIDYPGYPEQFRKNLALLSEEQGLTLSFDPNMDNEVYALALRSPDTYDPITVYAGGRFYWVKLGHVRPSLAEVSALTGEPTIWIPPVTEGAIRAIAYTGTPSGVGTVWVGGDFKEAGLPRFGSAYEASTGSATGWDPGTDLGISALLVRSGLVYIGGKFHTVQGQPRSGVACVTSSGVGSLTAWNPEPNGDVNALTQNGGTIYVGGSFSAISGWPHDGVAGVGDGTVTSVLSEPVPPGATVLRAAPNPFGRETTARFRLERAEIVDISVYDVAGRRVRRLHHGLLDAGERTVSWGGRDDLDRVVSPGVYFLRVRGRFTDQSAKLHWLR